MNREEFKKERNRDIIIITIVILLACWFYWFQIRPANAKAECAKKLNEMEGLTVKNYEVVLDICMASKGL